MQSLTLAGASRRFLQAHLQLRFETQHGQYTISLSIAAIICSWRYKNKKINGLNYSCLLTSKAGLDCFQTAGRYQIIQMRIS